jgi:hypothetical protein
VGRHVSCCHLPSCCCTPSSLHHRSPSLVLYRAWQSLSAVSSKSDDAQVALCLLHHFALVSWAVSWLDHFALISHVLRVHVQNLRCECYPTVKMHLFCECSQPHESHSKKHELVSQDIFSVIKIIIIFRRRKYHGYPTIRPATAHGGGGVRRSADVVHEVGASAPTRSLHWSPTMRYPASTSFCRSPALYGAIDEPRGGLPVVQAKHINGPRIWPKREAPV